MKTWDILGLGCVAVDDLLYVPSFPVANTKVRVLTRERQCGGLAGTALVTAARLGARCAFAGLLGTDELSRVIEENFEREGVEVSFAPRSEDAPTPHSVIIMGTKPARGISSIESKGTSVRMTGCRTNPSFGPRGSSLLIKYGMAGNLRAVSIARAARNRWKRI